MTISTTIGIFICGVGGQGIGLLGDVICETLAGAGKQVMATETHGVAQRGGIVTTHVRFGPSVRTPKICEGEADFVFALERLEGVRFAQSMLRPGGKLIFYDAVVQPQPTRSQGEHYPDGNDLTTLRKRLNIHIDSVCLADLPGPQMQNVALLGRIAALKIIDGITPDSVRAALTRLLSPRIRDINLSVFDNAVNFVPLPVNAQNEIASRSRDGHKRSTQLRAFNVLKSVSDAGLKTFAGGVQRAPFNQFEKQ